MNLKTILLGAVITAVSVLLILLVAAGLSNMQASRNKSYKQIVTNDETRLGLKWEAISNPFHPRSDVSAFRTRTPQGWLVAGPNSICYVPDPKHEWTK